LTIRLGNGEFYGRTLVERSTRHLNLVLTRYAAGQRLPVHAHERPYLALVSTGGFEECIDGRGYDCEEGSLVLNTVGADHSDRFRADRTEVLNVELDEEWLDALRADGWDDRRPAWSDRLPVRSRVRGLAGELERPERLSAFVIEGLCAELLGFAARTGSSVVRGGAPPAWLAVVERTLVERFRHPPSLGELGRLAGISPTHLVRIFRARHGCSVGGFARRLRSEHAREAVVHTRRELAEIALESGYADQSHMTREFRRRFGCTPGEMRGR
jgi:AraC family transcriptional regulator